MKTMMIKSSVLLAAAVGLSSCIATPKSGDATLAVYRLASTSGMAGATGIEAFTKTFYAFARTNCASCHGAAQAPLFAVTPAAAAYSVANSASYVSFTSPAVSKLAVYSGNSHCGLPSCATNAATAAAQIQAWAAVELATASSGGGTTPGGGGTDSPNTGTVGSSSYVTTSLQIPGPLPTGTTYLPMRWQLSQLTPANTLGNGAIFELEIQRLSSTTYRVRNPKIAGLRSIVRVTGVHVLVKPSADAGYGVEDLGAGSVWENTVANVPTSNLPANLPATPLSTTTFPPLDSFAMVIGIRSNQDSLTVAFDKFESGAAIAPTFASINTNILIPKCVSCHSTGNALGGKSYSSYAETMTSVVAGNPGASRLFGSTSGANPSMPTGSLKLTTAETTAISTWITNGALNN